ncbi:CGNR zinc finger domain-containing protein [Kineococcus sp. SYSU DK002]|uniref:CGNR zinc finger domain-containing protein n=1 Tax=Kineococcus sp. SYSU DK002 TaxID=3383123 RepID=UPI003D7E0425
MHLNPYGEDAVRLAASLVNDRPATSSELLARCQEAGLVVPEIASDEDLPQLIALLDRWCDVIDAGDHHQRAQLLNRLLADSSAYPRLTDHAGGWHLHYRDDDVPLHHVLRALIVVGTALHLTVRGMDRLGRCAGVDCDRVYADTSRNGRQRYCSPPCANRNAVRRHRARLGAATC